MDPEKTEVENEDQGLLDAVNAAIAPDVFPEEPVQEEGETPSETGDSDGDVNPETEQPPEEAPETEQTPEEEPETEKPKEGEAEEPKDEEAKVEEVKPIDPLNDPIPTGVAARTRERIETLVGMVKEAETYKQNYHEVVSMVNSTGASPEEFGQMLQYMKMVHSDNPDDKRTALKVLQSELRGLAVQLGESDVPGFDPLADFKDLQQAVELKEMAPEHAKELAVARLRKQDELTRQTHAMQQNQAQMSAQQAVEQGKATLNTLGQKLSADPDYEAKAAVLVPMLKETFNSIHPTQWAVVFENAYRNLKVPAAPKPTPKPVPKNQPMRAKAPAGNSDPGINSALDAVNAALGM